MDSEELNAIKADLTVLGYRYLDVLGAGSHGVVILVEHLRLGKRRAVKLIRSSLTSHTDIVQRVDREARVISGLEHEAFVAIHDLGTSASGRTYFIMDYVEGTTLQELLRARRWLPVDEAVGHTIQLLEGLAVAHDAGIVHRDIKPANLFVTVRGRVKILDFGIAKAMQDASTGSDTAIGVAIGTPKYMSPEQTRGEKVSSSADQYCAGLVLFEMLAGEPVFDGTVNFDVMRRHYSETAPTLHERAGRLFDPELEAIVARMLRKHSDERFPTTRAAADALRAFRARLAQPTASDGSIDRTSNENEKVTIRVSNASYAPVAGEGARPTEAGSTSTRPIRAEALVLGAATTAPHYVDQVAGTEKTEALLVLQGDDPVSTTTTPAIAPLQSSASIAADSAQLEVQRRRGGAVLLVAAVAGALALLVATAIAVLLFIRPRGLGAPTAAASVSATQFSPAPIQPMTLNVPSASIASPVSPLATASVSAGTSAPSIVPSALPKALATAKPAPSSSKPSSHYQAALDAMDAGDLNQADIEARLAISNGGGLQARLLHAQILEKRGMKAAARDAYRQILETNPDMAAAVAGLKRCGG